MTEDKTIDLEGRFPPLNESEDLSKTLFERQEFERQRRIGMTDPEETKDLRRAA